MYLVKLFSVRHLIYLILFSLGSWQLSAGAFIHAKAKVAQYLLDNSWDKTIKSQQKIKPWAWADTYPVAKISFLKNKKDFIVLAGANGRTMAFGPGHLSSSPLPGNNGNSVIVGHRDTHFKVLKNLKLGDDIIVQTSNKYLSYSVSSIFIVDQAQTEIMHDYGREKLTLITCYPFDTLQTGGPLRYVVQASSKKI